MRPRGVLLLVPALALLPGCFYVGARASFGPAFTREQVARIVPGESTRTDVLALLGPPAEFKRPELTTIRLDEGLRLSEVLSTMRMAEDVYTWQRDDLSFDGTVLLLYNHLATHTRSTLVVVFFDADGLVLDVASGVVETEEAEG